MQESRLGQEETYPRERAAFSGQEPPTPSHGFFHDWDI
jgi:hypothetical protein